MIARSTGAAPRQEAVVANDDRMRRDADPVVELCGLLDRDPETLGHLLRRRSGDSPAPSRRLVRPREQLHDFVVGGEPLEHVGAERPGRGDRDLRHD